MGATGGRLCGLSGLRKTVGRCHVGITVSSKWARNPLRPIAWPNLSQNSTKSRRSSQKNTIAYRVMFPSTFVSELLDPSFHTQGKLSLRACRVSGCLERRGRASAHGSSVDADSRQLPALARLC